MNNYLSIDIWFYNLWVCKCLYKLSITIFHFKLYSWYIKPIVVRCKMDFIHINLCALYYIIFK